MRKLRFFIICALCLLMAGCYEVNEEIVIDNNGSGTFTSKMDMSQLMQMMRSFADSAEMSKNGLMRTIDTTIILKSMTDSAKDITADQRNLLQNGKIQVKMNASDNLFKMDAFFPFKSYSGLQQLMSGSAMKGLQGALRHEFGKDQDSQNDMANQLTDQLTNMFDITVNKTQVSRKLNMEKFKVISERQEFQQMKMMTNAGMEVLYTTVIRLPRPVKKAEGDLVKLSEDKKTVTLKYDLLKMLDNPEKLNYSITY